MGEFTVWQVVLLVQHELLLFAGLFFLFGAIDEFLVDLIYLWLRFTGRARTGRLDLATLAAPLGGQAAVFIPTWKEAGVIGATIRHALDCWPQDHLRIYVGCYRNDPATIAAVIAATQCDPRVRLVIHGCMGPSTKADCLNRLYRALQSDEAQSKVRAHMVVLHDAEDMVDPAGLVLLDRAIRTSDLAQLPVLPVPQPDSPWISGHYCEEFAESHGKAMVVRDAVRAGLPLAGVGCAISRATLDLLAQKSATRMPFAADCLTEDYELGLGVAEMGGSARFIRIRHADGTLVATRACFPARLDQAVRQKTRWVHGIAFQAWDRLGWRSSRPAELWMRLRDRRGPFTALTLAVAYLLLILSVAAWALQSFGTGGAPLVIGAELQLVLLLNFASFLWRVGWRFAFTARDYGLEEGLRAIIRIPVANIVAIMAGRRALIAYIGTLRGRSVTWDKTSHSAHPVTMAHLRRAM